MTESEARDAALRQPPQEVLGDDAGGREDRAVDGREHGRHDRQDEDHRADRMQQEPSQNRQDRALVARREQCGGEAEPDRNRTEHEIREPGEEARTAGDRSRAGGEDALHQILAGKVPQCASRQDGEPSEHRLDIFVRHQCETIGWGLFDESQPAGCDIAGPECQQRRRGDHDEPDHEERGLQGVGHHHRPHTADQRVARTDRRHDQETQRRIDPEEQLEQQSEGDELRRDPTEVARHHEERA